MCPWWCRYQAPLEWPFLTLKPHDSDHIIVTLVDDVIGAKSRVVNMVPRKPSPPQCAAPSLCWLQPSLGLWLGCFCSHRQQTVTRPHLGIYLHQRKEKRWVSHAINNYVTSLPFFSSPLTIISTIKTNGQEYVHKDTQTQMYTQQGGAWPAVET